MYSAQLQSVSACIKYVLTSSTCDASSEFTGTSIGTNFAFLFLYFDRYKQLCGLIHN